MKPRAMSTDPKFTSAGPFPDAVVRAAGSPSIAVPSVVQPGNERAIDLSGPAGPIAGHALDVIGDATSGKSLGSNPERRGAPFTSNGKRL